MDPSDKTILKNSELPSTPVKSIILHEESFENSTEQQIEDPIGNDTKNSENELNDGEHETAILDNVIVEQETHQDLQQKTEFVNEPLAYSPSKYDKLW